MFDTATRHRGGYRIFAWRVNGGFREQYRPDEFTRSGKWNRCILGRNGRRTSWRRAMRRRRSV